MDPRHIEAVRNALSKVRAGQTRAFVYLEEGDRKVLHVDAAFEDPGRFDTLVEVNRLLSTKDWGPPFGDTARLCWGVARAPKTGLVRLGVDGQRNNANHALVQKGLTKLKAKLGVQAFLVEANGADEGVKTPREDVRKDVVEEQEDPREGARKEIAAAWARLVLRHEELQLDAPAEDPTFEEVREVLETVRSFDPDVAVEAARERVDDLVEAAEACAGVAESIRAAAAEHDERLRVVKATTQTKPAVTEALRALATGRDDAPERHLGEIVGAFSGELGAHLADAAEAATLLFDHLAHAGMAVDDVKDAEWALTDALKATRRNDGSGFVLAMRAWAEASAGYPRFRKAPEDVEADPARFLEAYPAAARLLEGVRPTMTSAEKLTCVVRNFRKLNFTYSMKFEANEKTILATGAGSGDCHTLALVMEKIAVECLGIPVVVRSMGNFMADPALTIDQARQPNGFGGSHWLFENHFWVTGFGVECDPLFGDLCDKSSWKPKKSERTVHGKPYYVDEEVYGDVKIYGPFEDGGPLYSIGWPEDRWQAHKKRIDARVLHEEEERKRKEAEVEETPPDPTVRALLGEVRDIPSDVFEPLAVRLEVQFGERPEGMGMFNELKRFCTGNPFMGFTFVPDLYEKWLAGK